MKSVHIINFHLFDNFCAFIINSSLLFFFFITNDTKASNKREWYVLIFVVIVDKLKSRILIVFNWIIRLMAIDSKRKRAKHNTYGNGNVLTCFLYLLFADWVCAHSLYCIYDHFTLGASASQSLEPRRIYIYLL